MSATDQERVALERVRNIGILAHIDAGKTTLTERILYLTGVSRWLGEVDHGTATMDWLPEEQHRGITILAATTMCPWAGHQINLIDTPGHVDFTAEVERSLRVLDGAVVVVSGLEGVQPQTERVWRQADRHAVPRIVFVNKLDRIGASLDLALASLRERLEVEPVTLTLPLGDEADFDGVLDLVGQRVLRFPRGRASQVEPVPASLQDALELGRELLLDAVLLDDEEALALFYETGDLPAAVVWRLVRAATLRGLVVPVFCGAAKHNLGVQPLLDGIVQLLPAPSDRPPAVGRSGDAPGDAPSRPPRDDVPFAALVFKFQSHGLGDLSFLRVYSGTAATGDALSVARLPDPITLGPLGRVFASELVPVHRAMAGDIIAVQDQAGLVTGDTLHAVGHPIALEPIALPEPVLYVALEPRTEEDDRRLRACVPWLRRRDPALQVRVESETGRQLLCGMGELHLEIALEWLRRERSIGVDAGAPQVAYREVPGGQATGIGLVDRLVAGRGRFAEVSIRVRPRSPGQGTRVAVQDRMSPPRAWVHSAVIGIHEGLRIGPAGGFPVVDIDIQLTGIRHHDVDSTEQAFRLAGGLAVAQALTSAGTTIIEPTMRVEIVTPEDYMGAVLGDLHSRRGNVLEMVARGRQQSVQASVPLADLRGYATALRSLTQGRANYSMHLDSYTPLPAKLAEQLTGRS